MERMYLCVDLKTFYASVECAERGLNPFHTNLAVADISRGPGTICLAISPAMKALGIKNRCRLFEIPKNVSFIAAKPRMRLYMEYSKRIYQIYLKYIAKEDIFVYSIDECFLDITAYLPLYGQTPQELARRIVDDIHTATGVPAAVAIGTNLFLAKVALDITAKHRPDNMGFLNEELFKKTIWFHTPITDIWNIGRGYAKRLAKYNAFSLYAVAHLEERLLYEEFGVNAEYLIDHARGIEPCTIEDIHNYKPKNKSLSNHQVLFEDYSYDDALLVLKEMVEINVLNLVAKGLVTSRISLSVGYSKHCIPATGGGRKLYELTNSYKKLNEYFLDLYRQTTNPSVMIRKIGIGFGGVVDDRYKTYDLFMDEAFEEKELNLQRALLQIKDKYGKNSVFKGMNLEPQATMRKRNKLIGGHNAE